jgi:CheY-like chemotaxis protein
LSARLKELKNNNGSQGISGRRFEFLPPSGQRNHHSGSPDDGDRHGPERAGGGGQGEQLRPDVITMDIEMPVLDGISAVREIMAKCPTPILMFSSLTHEGAKATLDALDAGAPRFSAQEFEDIARDKDEAVACCSSGSRRSLANAS